MPTAEEAMTVTSEGPLGKKYRNLFAEHALPSLAKNLVTQK